MEEGEIRKHINIPKEFYGKSCVIKIDEVNRNPLKHSYELSMSIKILKPITVHDETLKLMTAQDLINLVTAETMEKVE